jgi:hypothetical protein
MPANATSRCWQVFPIAMETRVSIRRHHRGMRIHEFAIAKVELLVRGGCSDLVIMTISGNTPFPEMDAEKPGAFSPILRVETRNGYGAEWCAKMGILIDEVVRIP